jgi:hypothetical protein
LTSDLFAFKLNSIRHEQKRRVNSNLAATIFLD